MKRIATVALALLAALLTVPVPAQTEKVPDIKEIMAKANKPGGHYFALRRDLKDETPPWDEVQASAKALSKLAVALTKNTPPKGDKASWDMLTKAYADNAKKLEDAANKKDKKAAEAAALAMGDTACNACHKAHRK
jgi:hypothetical protein